MTTIAETSTFAAPRSWTLPRAASFGVVAATTAMLLAASSAPSPLYAVYQATYGFSSLTLTAIFAVYVLALLATLLTVGRLSDYLGRRPVLAASLVLEAGAMTVFLDAHGVGALFAARIVQGIATGAAVGVLGAYLLDLQPPDGSRLGSLVNSAAATGGLGLGAAATGVLVQYAPHPTRLVFVILASTFVVLAAASALLPETVTRRPGAGRALRPQVAVPTAARRAFGTAAPMMASSWMLGGLMLSVGGSLLAGVFATTNHAVIGAVLGLFAVTGALMVVALRELPPARMSRIGTVTLLAGVITLVVALATTTLWLFVVSIAIAGAGFGPTVLGAFRSMSLLAAPHERAALISAIYVASYLAFSLPAVVAGVVLTRVALRPTALVYAVIVGVVVAATLVLEARTTRPASAG